MEENKEIKSYFSDLSPPPPDAILGVNAEFVKDKNENKVNLGVGAYKDENGNPYILKSVEKAFENYIKNKEGHEYLPIGGFKELLDRAVSLIFSKDFKYEKNVARIQTISGSGALRLGLLFLSRFLKNGKKKVYCPLPTWNNHRNICQEAEMQYAQYRYFDYKSKDIDFSGVCEDLHKIEEGEIVLFHACAHNPTGCDFSKEQWKKILYILKEKNIFVVFDMAYQGICSGDLDEDAYAVRLFANEGIPIMVAQSFAKNLGLYGERIGTLTMLLSCPTERKTVESFLERLVRSEYSSPPRFGAVIANYVLKDEQLYNMWKQDLKTMASRIKKMREMLKQKLEQLGAKGNWEFLVTQKGMFAYTGLSEEQVKRLKEEFHIYLVHTGRISISGLNEHNIDYVANAIYTVTK